MGPFLMVAHLHRFQQACRVANEKVQGGIPKYGFLPNTDAESKVAQVIFFPSRPGYRDPAVTRRIMDYMLFMNSKVLFKVVS